MKIKTNQQTLLMLKSNLNKILLKDSHIYVITEIESIEEEEEIVKKANFFRNGSTKKVVNTYITKLVIQSVHNTGKFVGVLTDESCESFIYFYDLYKLRQNWLNMKEQIELYGFHVVRKPEPEMIIDDSGSMKPTVPDIKPTPCPICGKSHEEYHLCTPCPLTEAINNLK
jgi:hypothetical protein